MTFEHIKQLEPELHRLEQSAEHAGRHGASWLDVLMATNEQLTKCCGRGAWCEELQTAEAYETSRAGLFTAWSRGAKRETQKQSITTSALQLSTRGGNTF